MTFREKLAKEHPECVDEKYDGGCKGCPYEYGYEKPFSCGVMRCSKCWDREIPTEKIYEDGLNDAWELAKKLARYSPKELDGMYFSSLTHALIEHTYKEALAKLKAYEEEQEIKVGDVVTTINGECEYLVTKIQDLNTLHVINGRNGYVMQMKKKSAKKTSKHIDIEKILGQIRGE